VRLLPTRKPVPVVGSETDDVAAPTLPQTDIRAAVDAVVAQIEELSVTLADSSEGASAATQEIGQNLYQVVQGAIEQSERAAHAVSSIETLDGAVERITHGADQVSGVVETLRSALTDVVEASQEASALGEQGGRALDSVKTGMQSIHESATDSASRIEELIHLAAEIGRFVSVSREISEQVKLLALNAAIEAARAGEHGRGFRVVADEVGNLAGRSRDAADQIGDVVGRIQQHTNETAAVMQRMTGQVDEGTDLTNRADAVLQHILTAMQTVVPAMRDSVQTAATAAEEQVEATQEMATMSREIKDAAHDMAEIATRTTDLAQGSPRRPKRSPARSRA
jgi:methyl-accepting chemotaxis protein